MSRFKPAVREKVRCRMALDGTAGAGKTYTALRFAFALATRGNGRVAITASERGRAKLYEGLAPDGIPWKFDLDELLNFSPTEYTASIEAAGRGGYDVLIIDSLSHAWEGKDGALEQVDRKGKGTGWKDVTPQHRRMIDAILSSPCHVIATMRVKTVYDFERDERDKIRMRKIGQAPIQRAGMEYEFDVYGNMEQGNILTITKTVCPALQEATAIKPGPDFIAPLITWLETGIDAPVSPGTILTPVGISDEQIANLLRAGAVTNRDLQALQAETWDRFGVRVLKNLDASQYTEMMQRLEAAARNTRPKTNGHQAPATPANAATPVEIKTPPAPPPASTGGEGEGPAPTGITAPENRLTEKQLALLLECRAEFFRFYMPDATKEQLAAKWSAILAKRQVKSAKELSGVKADMLIADLRNKITAKQLELGLAGKSEPAPAGAGAGTGAGQSFPSSASNG